MVSLAERGLGSVLAENPDLFRQTFRRGELYNAASSSRGVQCQLLASTSSSLSASTPSDKLHWTYGPSIYRHLRDVRTGRPKNLAHFCTPYNFIKYWPIFELFSQSKSGENLYRSHRISSVSLHYLVKCQCLTATVENKTSVITHLMINNRKQRVYCLSHCLK